MSRSSAIAQNGDLPQLLDVAGIAARLGVSERYIRRLVAERRIPFIKWGHYIRFNPVEVMKWLEHATVDARTEASEYW